jgi:hypothetical protein
MYIYTHDYILVYPSKQCYRSCSWAQGPQLCYRPPIFPLVHHFFQLPHYGYTVLPWFFFFESRCFGSLTTSDLFGISKDVWNQISPEVSRFLARNAGSMVTMVVQWDGIAGLCGTGLINLGAFLWQMTIWIVNIYIYTYKNIWMWWWKWW